ncbi:hypothetical protein BX600DRAFT_464622 [Xylariales sp. PMI_506]|nr:hypothetical protein BX600DRAFT_464622 [Xylariales sp. PMI_506]
MPPPKRASTVPVDADFLYCRYSLDLQYVRHKPLAATFAPGGSCRCPACGVRLDVGADAVWEIAKREPCAVVLESGRRERAALEEREFRLGQRFIIKCHTPDGEYACVLCSRHRDRDCICPDVESLVNHVGRFHDLAELEREVDFDARATKLLPLPASSGSSAS